LHFGGRSSSSWLRLCNHGGVPGSICRHRRHVWGRFLVQDSQRCPGLSTKATTLAKRTWSQEGTRPALTGRVEIRNAAAPELDLGGRNSSMAPSFETHRRSAPSPTWGPPGEARRTTVHWARAGRSRRETARPVFATRAATNGARRDGTHAEFECATITPYEWPIRQTKLCQVDAIQGGY
jgi:hypothetical protein